MDSLKEALSRHIANIKAKLHNQGGGHLPQLGHVTDEAKENANGYVSDHAPELEGSVKEEAGESNHEEMGEQEQMVHPDHAPQGPHLMARTGGALSPDEHAKIISALAQSGEHPGRPASSFQEKVADKSKEKFASMNKAKHKV